MRVFVQSCVRISHQYITNRYTCFDPIFLLRTIVPEYPISHPNINEYIILKVCLGKIEYYCHLLIHIMHQYEMETQRISIFCK